LPAKIGNAERIPVSSEMLMRDYMELLRQQIEHPEKFKGWNTGISDLDKVLGGLHRGWYFIVAGQRKAGKTAFITTMTKWLGDQGVRFLRISLEESLMQIAERQVSHQTGISREMFRDALLTRAELPQLEKATKEVSKYDGYWDYGVPTVAEIKKEALLVGAEVVFVDYVQLMSAGGTPESRTVEVGSISRELKLMTLQDPPITVVAAAQVNEQGEYLWSRDLGRDADVAIKLTRVTDQHGIVEENKLEMEIADSRHSGHGKYSLYFNGARSLVGSAVTWDQKLKEQDKGTKR
jgi:replicative DNA helicase